MKAVGRSLSCLGVVFFLLVFSWQFIYLAKTNSPVSDELAHVTAGYTYLKYHTYKLNPEHPPLVKQIAAIPLLFMNLDFPVDHPSWKENGDQWMLARIFLYGGKNPVEKMVYYSRLILLPLAWLLGYLLFAWAKSLFGQAAGFFVLFLYVLTPDFVAHSSLVTTDFALTVFFFGACFMLYQYSLYLRNFYLVLAGVFGGFAMLSKFSGILIVPIFYLAALLFSLRTKNENLPKRLPFLFLLPVLVCAATQREAFLVISLPLVFVCLQHLIPKWGLFDKEKLRSFMVISVILIGIGYLMIAVAYFEPMYWIEKFRPLKRFIRGWAIFQGHAKDGNHPSFLLGHVSNQGWPYYYLAAMFFKIPIPITIFSVFGMWSLIKNRQIQISRILFFVVPGLFFFSVASLANKVNIGVRHVLPVYPFILVAASAGFVWCVSQKMFKPVFLILSLAVSGWLVGSTAYAFPHYLSYFNEFSRLAGGKEQILGDSNICWGQDLLRLRDYIRLKSYAEVKGSVLLHFPEEYQYYQIPFTNYADGLVSQNPGVYVVDTFFYQKYMLKNSDYAWARDRKPDDEIGGCFKVYKF